MYRRSSQVALACTSNSRTPRLAVSLASWTLTDVTIVETLVSRLVPLGAITLITGHDFNSLISQHIKFLEYFAPKLVATLTMLASGFTNAPITRSLLIAIVAASILASITDTKPYFWIAVHPHLVNYRQFWRLLTWPLCYTNSTEALFGAMTLYQLRVIERLWGSRKFGSFLLSTLPYTTLLPPLLLALVLRPLSWNTINHLPAGPTSLLFALLAQYHAAIPHSYKYNLSSSTESSSSITLTSKATSYLLPAQLALSQLPGSLLVAAIGWVVGVAYRREILPGAAAWRVPDLAGKRKERERYEGMRRRMEGEAVRGVDGTGESQGEERRRGVAGQILDQFRGAF